MAEQQICSLDQKKCVPCEGGLTPLTRQQADVFLKDVPGWAIAADGLAIERHFAFKNFKQALALVNKIGEIAESEGHHPDLAVGWGYVDCKLTTHAINGLHENDFIVATKINALS
jgi:4a-hydroxytetrahydrobiopterin dehydratase